MQSAAVSLRSVGVGRVDQRKQQTPRRRPSVVRAAWSPFQPGQQQQPDEDAAKWRSLFSGNFMPPSNNPATAYDCRDALEVCGGLWGDQRRDCLTVFGLDPHQVDVYYTTVMNLEQALLQDTDPEEEASHRGQERC